MPPSSKGTPRHQRRARNLKVRRRFVRLDPVPEGLVALRNGGPLGPEGAAESILTVFTKKAGVAVGAEEPPNSSRGGEERAPREGLHAQTAGVARVRSIAWHAV